jgi:hypothetical protein
MIRPVRYDPAVEQVEPDEAETIRGLDEQFKIILDTTSKDYGHAVRSVHAKGHGIARGTLHIHPGLPPELAQGIFARPGDHEAIFRLSTNAGDILDDSINLPRGLALKILGVDGPRLPGSERDTTQDFVLVNGPAFAAPTPKAFLPLSRCLQRPRTRPRAARGCCPGSSERRNRWSRQSVANRLC